MGKQKDKMLDSYRVLDLTEGGCLLCGKILADLGADVIKVEKPGGSASRNIGPFYKDIPHSEKSLFWFAYNLNKRGITLDIEHPDGREIFERLVRKADFIMESFESDYREKLGLSYSYFSELNPGIIVVSMTSFGQTGPKSKYKGSDLISWASGGAQYITGDADRPPVAVSFPQAEVNCALDAGVGALIAHWFRQLTGEGQHVDASMQESVLWLLWTAQLHWRVNKHIVTRNSDVMETTPGFLRRFLYPCQDGSVICVVRGGGAFKYSENLVEWMDEEGMASPWLKELDWKWAYSNEALTEDPESGVRIQEEVGNFFLTKTKEELLKEAVDRGLFIAPVWDIREASESPQLAERDFWRKVVYPELEDSIAHCGPFAKFNEPLNKIAHRAPLIGEHNEDIYIKELGFSKQELLSLKEAQVI